MKMTVAQAHRLNRSLTSIARGFAVGDARPVNLIKTVAAKLAIARNMRRLHTVLEPVEEIMTKERDRLMAEEKAANPEAKELSPERVAGFTKMIQELNQQPCDVELDKITQDDLDLEKFEGEEALMSLAVIDGDVMIS